MTATACTAADILASVVLCAEATVAPAVANWPTQFKECDKTDLHGSGRERQFRIIPAPSGGGEYQNTGTNSGVVQLVTRFIRFGLEVKWRQGTLTGSQFMGYVYADIHALGDRIQRRIASHDDEVTSGSLEGLDALDLDGEYQFSMDDTAHALYAVIPFKAQYTDDQVQL